MAELDVLLPDPRELVRRIGQSELPTRLISHVLVVSLVLFAAFGAVTSANGTDGAGPGFVGGLVVSPVRGAAAPTPEAEATAVELSVTPQIPVAEAVGSANPMPSFLLDRGTRATVPGGARALPTPVPVDPNATPLPGPAAAPPKAPTVRVAAPVPTNGVLVWPVPGGVISQYYSAGHLALDIAAPYGSTIVAAKSGTVTWAGWRNNGGGYVIEVNHGGGLHTVYNHLSAIWVSVGQAVTTGQGIGAVGQTGMATGPHCHFEVIINGVIDNPLRYF